VGNAKKISCKSKRKSGQKEKYGKMRRYLWKNGRKVAMNTKV
jgi:hypothetical protein